jgi:hypothetical protein
MKNITLWYIVNLIYAFREINEERSFMISS